MITKKRMKRMPGDLIFDHERKVKSRVIYCDPGVEMITRTEDGVFIRTDLSSMSKTRFDARFEIIHTLFNTHDHLWELPEYSNTEDFYNNACISMTINVPIEMRGDVDVDRGFCNFYEKLCWDSFSDGQSPIRNNNLYMKFAGADVKVVVPLSLIEDKRVEVYVNWKNILDYCSDEKTVFSENLILDDCWRNGVLNDGISMTSYKYKWYSKYKIAIRRPNESDYTARCLSIEDFCGKNPKYILWFNEK